MCPRNETYSPSIDHGSCTNKCEEPNEYGKCDYQIVDKCKCTDDIGKLWQAEKNEVAQHECSDYQSTLIGNWTILSNIACKLLAKISCKLASFAAVISRNAEKI